MAGFYREVKSYFVYLGRKYTLIPILVVGELSLLLVYCLFGIKGTPIETYRDLDCNLETNSDLGDMGISTSHQPIRDFGIVPC